MDAINIILCFLAQNEGNLSLFLFSSGRVGSGLKQLIEKYLDGALVRWAYVGLNGEWMNACPKLALSDDTVLLYAIML